MISISMDPSGRNLIISQQSPSPFVYLDHGPLMEIAEKHADRFVDALASKGGTLAFTWLHLIEASRVSDTTAGKIDDLLVRLGREHLVLLRITPEEVIRSEDELVAAQRVGRPLVAPHLDSELLNAHFQDWKKGQIDPFDLRGLIHSLRDFPTAASIEAARDETFPELINAIKRNADIYRMDLEKRKNVDTPVSGPKLAQPTRYIRKEAGRHVIRTGEPLANKRDIDDFHHTVVSISYCDLVVLDKKWREAARQIQDRVRQAGLLTHEAKVWSAKPAELSDFLDALEAFA